MGIEDAMSEVFEDPTFQKRMQLFMEMGPRNAGKGQVMSPKGISQNKGSPIAHNILTPGQEFNQDAQQLAGVGQSAFGGGM
jgi:hypothetical protein